RSRAITCREHARTSSQASRPTSGNISGGADWRRQTGLRTVADGEHSRAPGGHVPPRKPRQRAAGLSSPLESPVLDRLKSRGGAGNLLADARPIDGMHWDRASGGRRRRGPLFLESSSGCRGAPGVRFKRAATRAGRRSGSFAARRPVVGLPGAVVAPLCLFLLVRVELWCRNVSVLSLMG